MTITYLPLHCEQNYTSTDLQLKIVEEAVQSLSINHYVIRI